MKSISYNNTFRQLFNQPNRSFSRCSTNFINRSYGGTWKNARRVQNPNIVKEMPTYEFVRENKFKKTKLVYVCGVGATGSLGLPRFYQPSKKSVDEMRTRDVMMSEFRRVQAFQLTDKITDVACGQGFSIVAAEIPGSSHSALGFGFNTHSQIGYHAPRPGFPLEIVSTPSPIFLPTKHRVAQVSCGRTHSMLVDEAGNIFTLGNNNFGQCGRPIDEKEVYFGSKLVNHLTGVPANIKQILCGQDHSMFLTTDGCLYSFGWGADGQTGLGHYEAQPRPTRVRGDLESVNVIKVSCYADTVLALDDNGNLFGWGNSEYAQFSLLANDDSQQFNSPRHLDLVNVPGKIVDIAAGGTMCAVLNNHGQVFVWGFGILGKGPNVEHSDRPTLLPETLFGMNAYSPDTKVEKIFAGLSQFAAITNHGDLYTWGRNRGNLLGFKHSQNQYFPMRVDMSLANVKKIAFGCDHTCAIVEKVC